RFTCLMVCGGNARTTAPAGSPGRYSKVVHLLATITSCRIYRLSTLVLDRLGRFGRGLRVQVPAALGHRLEVLVELVDQRDAGGDVQRGDVLVADLVQVLDQRAQRVAVRGEQDRPVPAEVGHHGVVPVRQHPR